MQKPSPQGVPQPRIVGLAFLGVLWLMFATWQRSEHIHQCELIQDSLASQAETLSSAVTSGVQSHRWFGPFVQQQLPTTLEVLARSNNVLAIAVIVNDGSGEVFFAGDRERVDLVLPVGEHARGDTLQVVSSFSMRNNPPLHGDVADFVGVPASVDFHCVVVLDRTGMKAQIYREARNRLLIFALGTLLLIAAGAAWQFTVRLTQAEGATRVLQAETRHLRELGQAAAGLAHETRNPLGLIRGWTQRLVKSGLPTDVQQEQAEAVLEECDRVTARINQFLAFARQAEANLESVAVDKLVADLQSLLQSDLLTNNLELETLRLDQPPAIWADRDQLRQVLFNLLQNAIAFAPQGSTITISLNHSKRGSFRLEVADQGPGATEEIVDSLFEPYVTRRPGGTGLGLSIVRRIAIAHGWDVDYEPGQGIGSVFWIDGIRSA
ncbi:sensor histidine kinase [Aureliella helgolandensis]|uniref:histidine kinase n=1 Tax=Aureliella helgolandensis TaxID=2527968 RepID=A0A518G7S6_9BACT|nr:ATP-binding protein [Aureliella helgolandensis]QDV24646.1 Sensor protein ZraS [Aureliella helgolandensis]